MKRATFVILCLCLLSIQTHAQKGFNLFVGTSIPIGDYGDEDLSNSTSIGTTAGFTAGVGYNLKFKDNFKLIFEASYNANKLHDDVKDSIENGLSLINPTIEYQTFSQIILVGGLEYQILSRSQFDLYLSAAIGAGLKNVSSFSAKDATREITLRYDPTTSFAARLGVCCLVADKFSVGAYYHNLGSSTVNGTSVSSSGERNLEIEYSINYIAFRLGYHF